jgi:Homocysteine S-methyltransferase
MVSRMFHSSSITERQLPRLLLISPRRTPRLLLLLLVLLDRLIPWNTQLYSVLLAFYIPPPDPANRTAANRTIRQVNCNITPNVIKDQAQEWINTGATVLGGCCGVGPEHIHALSSIRTINGNTP